MSMRQALLPFQEGREYDLSLPGLFVQPHVPPAILKACLPESVWDEYFKVVFVRNPWDWFVSQWKHNHRPGDPRISWRHAFCDPPRRTYDRLRLKRQKIPLARKELFDGADVDYLFSHLKGYRGLPGTEGLYQSNYVFDLDGRQLVDFVGRFEHLERDFRAVLDRAGIDVPLPHANRTQHSHHREHFTVEARERVRKLWRRDVDAFGYEF